MSDKILNHLFDITIFTAIFGALILGLVWAAEKEASLGISGMSSERILVRAELNENK